MKYIASIALLASAAMAQSGSQCDSGTLSCCSNIQQSSSDGLTGLIGLNCNPIGSSINLESICDSQPVCCSGTKDGGLTSTCVPPNANE